MRLSRCSTTSASPSPAWTSWPASASPHTFGVGSGSASERLSAVTDSASQVTGVDARLYGRVDPLGTGTHAYFEYGLDTGYGSTSDAYHRVQIAPDVEECVRAMRLALMPPMVVKSPVPLEPVTTVPRARTTADQTTSQEPNWRSSAPAARPAARRKASRMKACASGKHYDTATLRKFCDIWEEHGSGLIAMHGQSGDILFQGCKTDKIQTAWNGDWHTNINVQMNYWPAEVCNLSELHDPLFSLIESLTGPGAVTARKYYDADGWVAHVLSNPWGFTSPGESASWGSTAPRMRAMRMLQVDHDLADREQAHDQAQDGKLFHDSSPPQESVNICCYDFVNLA